MIQFENFNFYYKKNKPLLNDINITLEKGKIYGLFGKNGTGKTTFLKAICGLTFPKAGNVQLDDFIPQKRTPNFLSSIYYVPDEFELPKLSIQQYLDLFSPFYPQFSMSDFEEFAVGFEIPISGKPYEFSLGQQKKFIIAFALACNTDYLLLDEPTNGLDIPSKNQFRKTIASRMTDDKTILISTHQAKDLENLLDHILILNNAEFVFNGSTYEISEKLKFGFYQNKPQGDCLNCNPIAGGYLVLEENVDQEHTQINIEQLMTTVLEQPKKIQELFSTPKKMSHESNI